MLVNVKRLLIAVLVVLACVWAFQLFFGLDLSSLTPTSGNDIPSEWHSP